MQRTKGAIRDAEQETGEVDRPLASDERLDEQRDASDYRCREEAGPASKVAREGADEERGDDETELKQAGDELLEGRLDHVLAALAGNAEDAQEALHRLEAVDDRRVEVVPTKTR